MRGEDPTSAAVLFSSDAGDVSSPNPPVSFLPGPGPGVPKPEEVALLDVAAEGVSDCANGIGNHINTCDTIKEVCNFKVQKGEVSWATLWLREL